MDITLNGNKLTIEEIMEIGSDGVNIKLSNDSINRMRGPGIMLLEFSIVGQRYTASIPVSGASPT